jgi:hypothetical protein
VRRSVTAEDDDRFAQVVRRKLILEIAGSPVPIARQTAERIIGAGSARAPFTPRRRSPVMPWRH